MQLRPLLAALLTISLFGLMGCQPLGVQSSPSPLPKPDGMNEDIPDRSAESERLVRHYAYLQNDLLAQGLMRADGGGPDARFSKDDLVENFLRIALYDEYIFTNGRLIARESPSRLRRWEEQVRIGVNFGASIPVAQREKDQLNIRRYAQRLSRVTDHSIVVAENVNFHILILNEDERKNYAPQLKALIPGTSDRIITSILTMPRPTLCHVFAFSGGAGDNTYNTAVAIVRGEHPDLTRLACIHEELAQGLGLANDSRDARPSIFNDDEEFALLTRHDELLLEILYDPRLRPGMTPGDARETVELIAAELMGGNS